MKLPKHTFIALSMTLCIFSACASEVDDIETETNDDTKTLIAYFSAEGHTKAVAEAIQRETGADIFRIEAAEPYAANPYDDSDRIQKEAYEDRRPKVKEHISAEAMARYDTIFIGTPIWWHQPAMVVCTFLEHYNLRDKTIIPFITYGATTYLNETMQKVYRCSPYSKHIPATLPEDIDPENIRQPQNDDTGIEMPTAGTVRKWLQSIGYFSHAAGITETHHSYSGNPIYYDLCGRRYDKEPESGFFIANGRKTIKK